MKDIDLYEYDKETNHYHCKYCGRDYLSQAHFPDCISLQGEKCIRCGREYDYESTNQLCDECENELPIIRYEVSD